MIYLLLGGDSSAKEAKIAELKSEHLTNDDAVKFDSDAFRGADVDAVTLKKSLIALPAVAKRRLVVLRAIEKLNSQNRKILLDFIDSGQDHAVLVLETGEAPKNKFFAQLVKKAKVFRFGQEWVKTNVFDVTRAMDNRDPAGALKILNQLMRGGDHPLQIMGGLVWYWGRAKNRVSAESFKKGLLVLQEADLNIKRSRLKPENAVEIAVTKLSSLIAC